VQQNDTSAGQQDHAAGELREQLQQREQQLAELEAKYRDAEEVSTKKVQDLTEEIERVRQSAAQAAQRADSVQPAMSDAELNKLREQAKKMGEKEKLLVYELSKSKAQIMGLEKICEDFKKQLEQGK
ncbi:MAG: hypothetical protein K8I00_08710, partial [Candidatus Omnitrophica bacterium]|nr:hypothetical protein [Candidatus Omnitrophota bacterium]